MDHVWAAQQLREFVSGIDELSSVSGHRYRGHEAKPLADKLVSRDPIMRVLMNAARPGLGDYVTLDDAESVHYNADYWELSVKPWALRSIGIHELSEEAQRRMRPDSPDLIADQLHPWVWEAAAPLWYAGSRQEAVHSAARSVNARMQQKRRHHDKSDAALCREFFSLDKPARGRPRLRFPGYTRTDLTWRSRQQGAMEFGAGCFEGIRNPAAHEHGLILSEQVALEQLASFSLLARWIDECEVETVDADE